MQSKVRGKTVQGKEVITMQHVDLDYQLPKPIAQLLLAMVEVAERNEVLAVSCAKDPSDEKGAWDFRIKDPAKGESAVVKRLRDDPIEGLEMLGFVQHPSQRDMFLYPTAFTRARYERKGRFGKWLTRAYNRGRDVVLVVISTLTVLLTILQIIEIVQ
jgi:hypothetical protein